MRSSEILRENKWQPFRITDGRPDAIRALSAPGGVADRLRVVAFAELQARDAFRSGARRFSSQVPSAWTEEWNRFAEVEDRHAQMLLARMNELGIEAGERLVSDKLTRLCEKAEDPILFLFLLSSAEERGMESGFTLGQQMKAVDEASAAIFAQIASEEVEHVESAKRALAGQDHESLRQRARDLSALLR